MYILLISIHDQVVFCLKHSMIFHKKAKMLLCWWDAFHILSKTVCCIRFSLKLCVCHFHAIKSVYNLRQWELLASRIFPNSCDVIIQCGPKINAQPINLRVNKNIKSEWCRCRREAEKHKSVIESHLSAPYEKVESQRLRPPPPLYPCWFPRHCELRTLRNPQHAAASHLQHTSIPFSRFSPSVASSSPPGCGEQHDAGVGPRAGVLVHTREIW